MFKQSFITKRIAYLALLIAMSYALKSFISWETSVFRLSFYDMPLIVVGMMFGPFYGLFAGFIVDSLHIMTSPLALGYNLMTVSSMLWGFMGGLFFFRKKRLQTITVLCVITLSSALEFIINSVQLYGPQSLGFWQMSPIPAVFFRFGVSTIKIPIQIYLVKIMLERVLLHDALYLYHLKHHHQPN